MKNGLLLINLGTPDYPHWRAVQRFLAEFLCDARVIELPALLRYLLVYGIILPLRTRQTTQNYQKIWTPKGSPLLSHSLNLQSKLQKKLGQQWQVALGMRYGKPSLKKALEELKNCDHITVLPLYPQYSSAATGTAIAKCMQLLSAEKNIPSFKIIADFHQHPAFIEAQAELIQPFLANQDYFLFSYHGLPEYPLESSNLYKAQCHATSKALATTLGLASAQYETAFQSRLGKKAWLQPYTDALLPTLAKRGIKRLVVACPSFATDCLETLEEIGIRATAQWLSLGGTTLTLIPCVNDCNQWVSGLAQALLREDDPC